MDFSKNPTQEEIKTEDRKIRHLRRMADFTVALILQTPEMSIEEASGHIAGMRNLAMQLFPGKEEVFDLVYGPRFKRLLMDKYRLS